MALAALAWFLCSPAVIQAPDLSRRVSFVCRAERLERMLPELGKVLGVTLVPSPKVADEVMVVSVPNVLAADLMDRVAKVLACRWQPLGGGFQLEPSTVLRNIEERDARQTLVQAIRKSIDEQSAAEDDSYVLASSGPPTQYRLMLKLLDPEAIAGLSVGDRIVFSTHPTLAQRSFSGDPSPMVDAIVADLNRQSKSAAAAQEASDKLLSDRGEPLPIRERPTQIGGVAKAILAVTRESLDAYRVDLRLYDARGKVTLDGSPAFVGINLSANEDIFDKAHSAHGTADVQTPVDFCADSKELLPTVRTGIIDLGPQKPPPRFSPELLAKLAKPLEYDPLSFFATDQVLALAKKKGLPVVARLPDELNEANIANEPWAKLPSTAKKLRGRRSLRSKTSLSIPSWSTRGIRRRSFPRTRGLASGRCSRSRSSCRLRSLSRQWSPDTRWPRMRPS